MHEIELMRFKTMAVGDRRLHRNEPSAPNIIIEDHNLQTFFHTLSKKIWAPPIPGLWNKVGFFGYTANADGIRLERRTLEMVAVPAFCLSYRYGVRRSGYNTIS